MFSNTVAIRTSYTFEEVIYGVKFATMYTRSIDNAKLFCIWKVEFIYGCPFNV
jgi:hypothetical protein